MATTEMNCLAGGGGGVTSITGQDNVSLTANTSYTITNACKCLVVVLPGSSSVTSNYKLDGVSPDYVGVVNTSRATILGWLGVNAGASLVPAQSWGGSSLVYIN